MGQYAKLVLEKCSSDVTTVRRAGTNGKPESANICVHFAVLSSLNEYYKRTGEECIHTLEQNYYQYIVKTCLDAYNWEGQFEDSTLSKKLRKFNPLERR